MIKNLKADENNWFLEGTFDSDSLFQGEMSVSIFTDDGATVEDAEACIAQYQQLKKNAAFCANLQVMLAAYFLYMYDAWTITFDSIADFIHFLRIDEQCGIRKIRQ